MTLKKLDEKYTIMLESKPNKAGFKHIATLFEGSDEVARTAVQYYNRTWERYPFETAIKQVISKYCKENIKYYTRLYRETKDEYYKQQKEKFLQLEQNLLKKAYDWGL